MAADNLYRDCGTADPEEPVHTLLTVLEYWQVLCVVDCMIGAPQGSRLSLKTTHVHY